MTKSHAASSGLLLLLVSCAGNSGDPGPSGDGPTYYQDVAPLLAGSCSGCHVEGGVAPMALTTPESAQQRAPAIAAATAARLMPPWMPGGDSPAMHNDPRLTDAQIDMLQRWAQAGAPLGDAANAAALPAPKVVDIGAPEVSVDTGHDYVPDSRLRDDYRCFVVDLGLTEARMVTGLRITPGNRAAVHHVIVTAYVAADRAALEAAQGQDGRPGYQCFGRSEPPGMTPQGFPQMLGAWAPGASALKQPEGTGAPLEVGQVAVIQVHYNLRAQGATQPDRTRLELAFAPKGTESTLRETMTIPVADPQLNIPPGAVDHVEEAALTADAWSGGFFTFFFGPNGLDIVGLTGHMHMLGKHFVLTRTRAGQTTTLLEIPRWDFHWQNGYQPVQSIDIRSSDVVTIRCVYDNTSERREAGGFLSPMGEVNWGEGTEDEMCLAFLQVARRTAP
ncbi:MAG: hypothetical protein L0Y66_06840 [Myxococcaceae bacterium]|nr:hypothetical protein [Myxococcaceae bacterium]